MRNGWGSREADSTGNRYDKPVLFERQAVGGEYGAAFGHVGQGRIKTTFTPSDGGPDVVIW